MNDKSKKLKLFNKLMNHEEAGLPFTIREIWVDAFEEMLRIVDESRRSENHNTLNPLTIKDVISYINRAICDELGKANDAGDNKKKEPSMVVGNSPEDCDRGAAAIHESFSDYTTRRAWEVMKPTKQTGEDYCDCRYDDSCDSLRDRCASTPNLERKERLKSRDKVLTDAQKKAEDYAALLQAARKFYGVTNTETNDGTKT